MTGARGSSLNPTVNAKIQSVRVYDGESPIYVPDFEAIRTVYSTSVWPVNYRMYYSGRLEEGYNDLRDDEPILQSTVLWRNLSPREIQSYDDIMEAAREQLLKIPAFVYFPDGTKPVLSEKETERLQKLPEKQLAREEVRAELRAVPRGGRNRSVSAMSYIGQTWPEDFLQAYGIMDHHAGSSLGWGVVALPRRLFLQIAVIENIGGSGALYRVPGFSTMRSNRVDIRSEQHDLENQATFQPFAPGLIGRNDKIVIPLLIELRAHRGIGREDGQEFLEPSTNVAATILGQLRKAPKRVVSTEHLPTVIRKVASAFRDHSPGKITDVYRYGTRTTLTHINIDQARIPVRPYDANNVFMVAGFRGGSCPYSMFGGSKTMK